MRVPAVTGQRPQSIRKREDFPDLKLICLFIYMVGVVVGGGRLGLWDCVFIYMVATIIISVCLSTHLFFVDLVITAY